MDDIQHNGTRKTLTVKEVSTYLGVHTDTIYTMVRQQEIPHFKLRRKILFTKDSIDEWIDNQLNTNGKES